MNSRYIDMTPTWPQAVEILIAALEDGTETGKAASRAELRRMAQILERIANETEAGQ